MAKSVKDLVASMIGPRDGALPGIQAFPPLDLDLFAKEMPLPRSSTTRTS